MYSESEYMCIYLFSQNIYRLDGNKSFGHRHPSLCHLSIPIHFNPFAVDAIADAAAATESLHLMKLAVCFWMFGYIMIHPCSRSKYTRVCKSHDGRTSIYTSILYISHYTCTLVHIEKKIIPSTNYHAYIRYLEVKRKKNHPCVCWSESAVWFSA